MFRTLKHLLALMVTVNILCGCATEYNLATGREESLIYGTDKEVSIGDSVSAQLEKNYKVIDDIDLNARLQRILDRLTPVVDRKDLVYVIRVIDDDAVNAVSLPGGYIYVFKGLMDKVKNDDELAGVIAHELGHITARHSIKRMQSAYGYTILQVLAIASRDSDAVIGVNALATSVFLAYSRKDEFESDRLAVRYMKRAGYDPAAMARVLEILREEERRAPLQPVNYFRTHPYLPERIATVNKEISGQINFSDYLDLTGNE